jgi:hypothetical protein
MMRNAMLILVASISTVQPQGDVRAIIGPTNFSCGMWSNTPKQSDQHDVLRSWLFGFISGLNFESTSGDFLRGKDPDGLTAWIDSYCQKNPLNTPVTQAAVELVKELRSGGVPAKENRQ